ncbi:MAG: hypothetical protein OEV67_15680, partial [Betaproteobacteria bacterium]|nr:hypothetical protein [Betaproteobacteria bacterium]
GSGHGCLGRVVRIAVNSWQAGSENTSKRLLLHSACAIDVEFRDMVFISHRRVPAVRSDGNL